MTTAPPAPYYKFVDIALIQRRFAHLACITATILIAACDRGNHPTQLSKPAPDFTVSDGQNTIHLASYRGKIVMVNFWESHCGPCITELPSLLQFHHEHPDIPILAVSSDTDDESYKAFIAQRHMDLITVRDPQQSAGNKFSITGWPETFIIDRQGNIRRRFIGATDWSDPEILKFLKSI